MAWEQIGTYEGIPFWADTSLGLTDQDVLDDYLLAIQHEKGFLEGYGATASQAFVKEGRVFVVTADIKDYPGLTATTGYLSQKLPGIPVP